MGLRKWTANNLKGDIYIWGVVCILSIFGILAVYSSIGTLAYAKKAGNTEFYLIKQGGMLLLGLFVMWLSHLVDYRYYSRLSQVLLIIAIPLLFYTLVFGSNINEARRWITLPLIGLSFQTSDLAKLALIMYIARFLSKRQDKIGDNKRTLWPIVGSIALVCGLIAPANLSTALVLFMTCLVLLFIGRIPIKSLLGIVGIAIVCFGLMLAILVNLPGQGRFQTWKARITSFNDKSDEAGSYQNEQAKIAIAKGGLFGVRPGKSTQRNFLPSPYADFIFAIILEEYGMLGGLLLIFLYLFFLFRCIRIVIKSPKAFGALLAVGLAFSLVIQAFINMGVAVNIFPVTGLPLPLVSMGGTSTLFTSLAFGIILSVSRFIEGDDQAEEPEEEVAVATA